MRCRACPVPTPRSWKFRLHSQSPVVTCGPRIADATKSCERYRERPSERNLVGNKLSRPASLCSDRETREPPGQYGRDLKLLKVGTPAEKIGRHQTDWPFHVAS